MSTVFTSLKHFYADLCGTCTMFSFVSLGHRICVSFTRYFICMVQNTTSNFMSLTFVLLILNLSVNNYFADHHVGICLYYNAITQD